MKDWYKGVLIAGMLLVLLLLLTTIGLPYGVLDWTVYSQPYGPTETPTGTAAPPTATLTPTTTATATATFTLTPPATTTATPVTPEYLNYLPLIMRTDSMTR